MPHLGVGFQVIIDIVDTWGLFKQFGEFLGCLTANARRRSVDLRDYRLQYRRSWRHLHDLDAPAPDGRLRIVGSRSHPSGALATYLERLGPYELKPMGSSLKICLVADGQADVYPRLGPTSEWDTAAAQAVLESAGGSMISLDGRELRYNTKESLLNPHFLAVGDSGRDWLSAVPSETW